MSMPITSQTPGMVNVAPSASGQPPARTNLMESAVEMARNGLDQSEIARLNQQAASDGNVTANEQMLLQTLEADSAGFSTAVQNAARDPGFDPNGFSFNAMDSISLTSPEGHDITLQFSSNPSPAKEISGDIGEATRALERHIPAARRDEWNALNKHDVSSVSQFVNSLNLNLADRADFTQNYMTANYNHPGVDISWGGAGLQEGINAVPKDSNGRAYLDCEAYVKVAESMLGSSDQMSTYALASTPGSDRRDHQVAIRRDPNDPAHAYVISNNEVTRVDAGNRTPEQMIQSVYPDFRNVAEDRNGAMKFDSAAYNVGQVLSVDSSSGITVDSLDSATQMTGTLRHTDGSQYHVQMTIDEGTGDYSFKPSFKTRDQLVTNNGTVIRITGAGNPALAVATEASGATQRVRVRVGADGAISIE